METSGYVMSVNCCGLVLTYGELFTVLVFFGRGNYSEVNVQVLWEAR